MSVVAAVAGALQSAGWPGLVGAMAIENLVPPLLSELILPLAGSQVAAGAMSFVVALLAATAGSVLGAWALYAAGRFGGRPTVLRLRPLLRVDAERLTRAEAWFARRGAWLVLGGRLVPGVRALVSIPAGMARMPLWRFLALTALGSAAWNAGLITTGEALAARWSAVAGVLTPISTGLLLALTAALPAGWLWRRAHTPARASGSSR